MGKILSIKDGREIKGTKKALKKKEYKTAEEMFKDDECSISAKLEWAMRYANLVTANGFRKYDMLAALKWIFDTFDFSDYLE